MIPGVAWLVLYVPNDVSNAQHDEQIARCYDSFINIYSISQNILIECLDQLELVTYNCTLLVIQQK